MRWSQPEVLGQDSRARHLGRRRGPASDDGARGRADLIASGLIEPGSTLYARRKALSDRTATVLPDGRLDVDGQAFNTPSAAAKAISGGSENGWWFFVLAPGTRRSLSEVLHEYVDQTSADVEEEDDVVDEDNDKQADATE